MKHTFEESLTYFHKNGFKISIENDRFINFEGYSRYENFYFDLDLNEFLFDACEVDFEDAYHACNLIGSLYDESLDDFVKRCNAIFPEYVKRITVDYD